MRDLDGIFDTRSSGRSSTHVHASCRVARLGSLGATTPLLVLGGGRGRIDPLRRGRRPRAGPIRDQLVADHGIVDPAETGTIISRLTSDALVGLAHRSLLTLGELKSRAHSRKYTFHDCALDITGETKGSLDFATLRSG